MKPEVQAGVLGENELKTWMMFLKYRVRELCGDTRPIHVLMQDHTLPDYPNDLNAMHEAEKIALANEDTGYAYDMALCRIVQAYEVEGLCNHMRLFHATARQRAEAFVKTMEGKTT